MGVTPGEDVDCNIGSCGPGPVLNLGSSRGVTKHHTTALVAYNHGILSNLLSTSDFTRRLDCSSSFTILPRAQQDVY